MKLTFVSELTFKKHFFSSNSNKINDVVKLFIGNKITVNKDAIIPK
jgi:hypothetical protein